MIDYITIIGLIASVLTNGSLIPQIYKSWKTKKTKDLSKKMVVLFEIGFIMWLIYGFLINSLPLIFGNIISLMFGTYLLYLKLKYG